MARSILSLTLSIILIGAAGARAQNPYPNAVTDRLIHPKTLKWLPQVNKVFPDPDFGSLIVRVTDENTNFTHPGGFLRTEASGQSNMWSIDNKKFYVVAEGGTTLAFGFNPSTMVISSLPGAHLQGGLMVPLRPAASFSFVDPDLIYGTKSANPLAISSYRFSTGVSSPWN